MKKPGKVRPPKPRKRSAASRSVERRFRPVPGTVAVSAYARKPRGAQASAIALAARNDRLSLALLLAPFIIVALSLGAERAMRRFVAGAPQFIAAAQPPRTPLAPAASRPRPIPASHQKPSAARPPPPPLASPLLELPPPQLASLALLELPPPPLASLSLLELPPPPLASLSLLELPPPPLASLALLELPPPPLASLSLLELPPPPLASLALLELPPPPLASLALLELPPPPLASLSLLELPPPPLASLELLSLPSPPPAVCVASGTMPGTGRPAASVGPIAPRDAASFGRALSQSAMSQLREFVIYNPKYIRIAYPMGDVPSLFGVCTDVVVRAYRQVGIDLQVLIQQTRSGTGDRNIDHRRVEVMRRFLARHGEALPISEFSEDYQPGDIVTYYRPQNRSTTAHIAIVTDRLAPSGRPMIVHNRGWGPQLEDALFVDKITGHYRFSGLGSAAAGKPIARGRLTKEASVSRGRRVEPTQQ